MLKFQKLKHAFERFEQVGQRAIVEAFFRHAYSSSMDLKLVLSI